uniref:Uncharacterized protein n=1 Tax=Daphnia galeata TaxID=27404 RepID=A0A8J2WL13_9CRUS|nr:unnamed protein product [Daphnia galeata]
MADFEIFSSGVVRSQLRTNGLISLCLYAVHASEAGCIRNFFSSYLKMLQPKLAEWRILPRNLQLTRMA